MNVWCLDILLSYAKTNFFSSFDKKVVVHSLLPVTHNSYAKLYVHLRLAVIYIYPLEGGSIK